MVEMTEMGFRRIHILLFSVLGLTFAALPLAAQQPPVEARIAGLEGNEEYMSLLREDAVLQSRVDSVVRAVEQVRLRLREHPDERQACSEEILRLESRIFDLRNAKGRLIDRINTIEQEWVLANLDNPDAASSERPAARVPDSLKVRNLVYNPCFGEQLPKADYAALLRAQELELRAVDLVNRYFANYETAAQLAEAYAAAATESEAGEIYDRYGAMQRIDRALSDSLAGVWNYIFDNKNYAYGYLARQARAGGGADSRGGGAGQGTASGGFAAGRNGFGCRGRLFPAQTGARRLRGFGGRAARPRCGP